MQPSQTPAAPHASPPGAAAAAQPPRGPCPRGDRPWLGGGARRHRGRIRGSDRRAVAACSASSAKSTAARLKVGATTARARAASRRSRSVAADGIVGRPAGGADDEVAAICRQCQIDVFEQGGGVAELERHVDVRQDGRVGQRRFEPDHGHDFVAARHEGVTDAVAHVARSGDECSHVLRSLSCWKDRSNVQLRHTKRPQPPCGACGPREPRLAAPSRSFPIESRLGPCLQAGPHRLRLENAVGRHRGRSVAAQQPIVKSADRWARWRSPRR